MDVNQPKILIFTISAFSPDGVGPGTWIPLIEGYNHAKIANVYIRDELPRSNTCSRHFCISENKIIKSILNRKIQTGKEIHPDTSVDNGSEDIQAHNERYSKMKKKRRYSMLLAREAIWKVAKWKTRELDEFLDDFKPDVILHSMEGYIHLNRIIEYSIKRTGARAVGYIWDDNFTYKQSNKLGHNIYRFFQRGSLKRLAKNTESFFAISNKTKSEADKFFNIDCHLLTKPLNTTPTVNYGEIGDRINILYTGNLYIGRDKSLLKVIKAIKKLPVGRFFIDVYTNTQLPPEAMEQVDPKICCIHPPISQSEVLEKQREADILLFLEDIDGPDAKVARLSFSTKITDYLSAGKCILAVGNTDTAPMQYFIDNNAALICGNENEIYTSLSRILSSPEIIIETAENAAKAGIKNHNKEDIQSVFDKVIFKA